ncbi:MAG: hypothetical protein KF722_02105 [Nitrospira sp.]|nr:hypothetical protein [Nitrospira sp.]
MRPARMVLVVANAGDAVASAFVRRYARQGARLLRPGDLSRSGWRYELGDHVGPSQAVVGGRVCRETRLAGVITRLASVTPEDLPHIEPADRAYVAQEMQAFLSAWLHMLPCPVMNRPTPVCLAGEWWSPQMWMHRACRLGIPVARSEWWVVQGRRTKAIQQVRGESSTADITVVGSQIIGNAVPRVVQYASRLAQAAELDFVTVRFSSPNDDAQFLDAGLWPNLADRTIGAAAMRHVMRQCPSVRREAVSA